MFKVGLPPQGSVGSPFFSFYRSTKIMLKDKRIKFIRVLSEKCFLVGYGFGVKEMVCGKAEIRNGRIVNGERILKNPRQSRLGFFREN